MNQKESVFCVKCGTEKEIPWTTGCQMCGGKHFQPLVNKIDAGTGSNALFEEEWAARRVNQKGFEQEVCPNCDSRSFSVTIDGERSCFECKAIWQKKKPDPSKCPRCGGPADNGHDREIPPNPYYCTKCSELPPKAFCADEDPDPINHPPHYTSHPSGVKCIQITEYCNFCIGNAIKYLWRAGLKGDSLEDLKKARWYVDREISRLEIMPDKSSHE